MLFGHASPVVGDGESSGSVPEMGRKCSFSWTGEFSKAPKLSLEKGMDPAWIRSPFRPLRPGSMAWCVEVQRCLADLPNEERGAGTLACMESEQFVHAQRHLLFCSPFFPLTYFLV